MCCARCAHLCLTGGLHGPQICPKSPRWRTTTASALKTLQPVLEIGAPHLSAGGFGEETTSQHLQPQAPAVAAARDARGKRKQLTLANSTKKLQGLAYYLNGRITKTIFNHAVMEEQKTKKSPPPFYSLCQKQGHWVIQIETSVFLKRSSRVVKT